MVSTWTLVWTTGAAVWEAVQRCPPAAIVAATSRVVPAITLHRLDLRGGRNGASVSSCLKKVYHDKLRPFKG